MGLDPRRASSSAQGRSAQTISELETRIARLENSTKGAIIGSGITLQSSDLTLNTSGAIDAVPGCSFTTATQVATIVSVLAVGQQINFTGSDVRMYLYLDGVSQAGSIVVSSLVGKTMNGGGWRVALSAGSHTLALQASRVAGGSLVQLTNSSMTYFQSRA